MSARLFVMYCYFVLLLSDEHRPRDRAYLYFSHLAARTPSSCAHANIAVPTSHALTSAIGSRQSQFNMQSAQRSS